MKNIPRIFVGNDIRAGMIIPATREIAHYLGHVMRTRECLCFGGGNEFVGRLNDDGRTIIIGDQTAHPDPSSDVTLMFAPIKRCDDLINMATQMGVGKFQPVITDRVVEHHIKWDRMQKIAISAAEQSNRNSVPEICAPIKFSDLDLSTIVFADERAAHGADISEVTNANAILVGPEGGFSDAEFNRLDTCGARGISLGKTILRAELAAAIAISKIIK